MTGRQFITVAAIGVLGGLAGVGICWAVLDAYTRIAYALLGLQYPA